MQEPLMPISDAFENFTHDLSSPISGGFDITPNNGADLTAVTRALMVTVAGNVAVVLRSGTTITLPGLTPGVVYPFRVARVLATGTTATGLKGLI
jgi:hypothetical protein